MFPFVRCNNNCSRYKLCYPFCLKINNRILQAIYDQYRHDRRRKNFSKVYQLGRHRFIVSEHNKRNRTKPKCDERRYHYHQKKLQTYSLRAPSFCLNTRSMPDTISNAGSIKFCAPTMSRQMNATDTPRIAGT